MLIAVGARFLVVAVLAMLITIAAGLLVVVLAVALPAANRIARYQRQFGPRADRIGGI